MSSQQDNPDNPPPPTTPITVIQKTKILMKSLI